MKTVITALLSAMFFLSTAAQAKVTVAASLTDLASIAAYIGGDNVEVFSIARASNDPHTIEVLPTYMVRVSRADIDLKAGLSLDQWADLVVEGSRNSKVKLIDCSKGIPVLEKPSGKVDASMGDVHPEGNPHYWLDPNNGAIIAQTIADALIAADPANAAAYSDNLSKFQAEVKSKMEQWNAKLAAISNRSLISYHSTWTYFAHAFGFEVAAKMEPIPGIPPTASHLIEVEKVIKEKNVPVEIVEALYSKEAPDYLSRQTGIRQVKLEASCSDVKANSYLDHFDEIVNALTSGN